MQTRHRRFPGTGFTLIELLSVIAIIAVLAAIIAPVLARAKTSGKRAAQISVLRQTSIALMLYADNYGSDTAWPTLAVGRTQIGSEVTCDPLDSWRQNCTQDWDPLLGSFGYAIQTEQDRVFYEEHSRIAGEAVLLVSIFGETPSISSFHGDAPPPWMLADLDVNVRMPAFAIVSRTDGSAARVPTGLPKKVYMGWGALIVDLNFRK